MSDFNPNPPQQPSPQQPYQPKPPGPYFPPRKSHTGRTIALIIGGLFALLIVGSVLTPGSDPKATPPAAVSTVDNGPTPDPVVTPTNKPTAAKTTEKPKPSVKPSPKPAPVVYKKLTARQWAKIAKSPDAHTGEAYIVYGHVTQFDAATGDDQFRADVDGVKHAVEYGYVDYPTNTLMTNISGDLSDLVQDDLFTAKVMVLGSFSYDTQIGGETTVPQLSVMSIKVTGSVK
jgi:hypothetical protein